MKSFSFPNQQLLTSTAVALLTAGTLLAVPSPIARWNADGNVQPEPGGKARTINSVDIAYKQGVAGKAFSFNGKTSEIEAELVLNSFKFPTMTWSVWIRPTESAGNQSQYQTILSSKPGYYSLTIANGQLAINANGRSKPVAPVKWNIWQHVAVVFASDHATIYHRGGTTTIPLRNADYIAPSSLKGFFIGGSGGDYWHYSGLIDEAAVYDGELTQAGVAEIATRPNGREATGITKTDTKTPAKSAARPPQEWTNREGKSITAGFVRLDGDAVVVRNGGKEFRIPFAKLSDASIRQAKASAGADHGDASPAPIPSSPATLRMKVASGDTQIDRWGTGDKALVFFGHTGPMSESVVAGINSYAPLFTAGYSIFLWNYPAGRPFSETQNALQTWMQGKESKVNFAGVATEVVAGIRTQTGIKEFLLVGDSLGAGILLSDYAKLTAGGNVRIVLISPTEPFSPESKDLPPLENSLLLANSKGDDFARSPGFVKWLEGQKAKASLTGALPPGHLILGENLPHELLAWILADFSKVPHR